MCLVCVIRGEEKATSRMVAVGASGVGAGFVEDELDTTPPTHYFAIGSMVNPTSLALRGLAPLNSQPAKLSGWALKFVGGAGMASAEVSDDPDAHIHGVLHCMTANDMRKVHARNDNVFLIDGCGMRLFCTRIDLCLFHIFCVPHKFWDNQLDRIEGGYERVPCVVLPYAAGAEPLAASVYRMYAVPCLASSVYTHA
jgi:hypothetical protein